MKNNDEKVILFPKWRMMLEEESLLALQQKRYREALLKLNELLSYDIASHEIIVGKLICLMELGDYEEAMEMCEEIIANHKPEKDENYYHYVHIYLTILFQSEKYELLMERVQDELADNSISNMIREEFQQLYHISAKMNKDHHDKKKQAYADEFWAAVEQNDHIKQWNIIDRLRKMDAALPGNVIALLENPHIHPAVKTAIFLLLKDKHVSQTVTVHKLGLTMRINPMEAEDISAHKTVKHTLLLIGELEQKNPSLYLFLEQLFMRYAYIRYPIMPLVEEAGPIAEALEWIGYEYLNMEKESMEEVEARTKHFMEEIKLCEKLYLSIME